MHEVRLWCAGLDRGEPLHTPREFCQDTAAEQRSVDQRHGQSARKHRCSVASHYPGAGWGESSRTSRGIEVKIKIDPKLHDTPQQGALQHKSHVVIDTKDANAYVNLVATLAELLQEIAMLPKLCCKSFQMYINGRRFIHGRM